MSRISILKIAVGAVCVAAAMACHESRASALAGLRGVKLSPARSKPDFTLEDTDGKAYHFRADTRGTVTLLYFGYTNCPDVCPTHLSFIAAALRRMPANEQSKVRLVFVTTDPERDTPERLRGWLNNFDRRFVGLRGSLDSVNRIQGDLGLPAAAMEMADAHAAGPRANYSMGHAAQVLAFTPDDTLRTEYPSGFTADDWANDLPKLVRITP